MRTDSMCVYTNHPVGGAYRGFGMAELHTGVGQIMDMLADKIGMDRVEFLRKNCGARRRHPGDGDGDA